MNRVLGRNHATAVSGKMGVKPHRRLLLVHKLTQEYLPRSELRLKLIHPSCIVSNAGQSSFKLYCSGQYTANGGPSFKPFVCSHILQRYEKLVGNDLRWRLSIYLALTVSDSDTNDTRRSSGEHRDSNVASSRLKDVKMQSGKANQMAQSLAGAGDSLMELAFDGI